MGIVKISDKMHIAAKVSGQAMERSINSQAEYWMKIGKYAEENPEMTYNDIINFLLKSALHEKDNISFIKEVNEKNIR